MQKMVRLAICAVALGLGVNVASADVLTLAVTGHVASVSDSSLGITVNQAVTATYSYDTSTTPSSTGVYQPASPPANVTVAVAGGPTYQTQNNWTFQITVTNESGPFSIFNYTATSPASGTSGTTTLLIGYYDAQGQWLNPPALPTTVPPFNGAIQVNPPNSSGFTVQMDSVTQVPSITVSPSNSSFIAQQNFDAVLLLSATLSVTSMQASVNGTSIGFSYPGTCQLAAANNAQRTALICPAAAAVLAGLGGGPVTINWLITFADGSTAQQSVIWNLVH